MTRKEAQAEIIRQTSLYGGGVILRDSSAGTVTMWNSNEHEQDERGVILYQGRSFSNAVYRFLQWADRIHDVAEETYRAIEEAEEKNLLAA
jgi:hypothetical protein